MPRGLLFRGDDPLLASAKDKKRLANELQVQTVLDLRADMEIQSKGCGEFGANLIYCDLPPNGKAHLMRMIKSYKDGAAGMANANGVFLEVGKPSLARAFRSMMKPGALPAFFHCSVGKDRTGLLAMLLLSFCGASDEEIAADYALTMEFVPPSEEAMNKAKKFMKMANVKLDDEQAINVLKSEPEVAHGTMAIIRRVYGSAEGYFRKHLEFTDAEVMALRKALTTPPRPHSDVVLSRAAGLSCVLALVAIAYTRRPR